LPAPSPAQTSIEEERLGGAVPQRLVRHGGLAAALPRLEEALAGAGGAAEAERVIARQGRSLWREAVRRLRESDGDDRPLYWTRLALSKVIRAWRPGFPVDTAALLDALDRGSRGLEGNRLPAGEGRLRIVVTGFDPFRLDRDIRRGNPSGAAALALHGTTVRTPAGHTAHIEAAVLPVRWADFTDGIVERTLRPYLEPGPRQVDLFVTISQGRPGAFDLERFNGGWRGGGADNSRAEATGPVPGAGQEDGGAGPAWTESTLPYARLTAEPSGRFPVRDHTAVTELPPDATEPLTRPDGPTPGSAARAGGGGCYLSNEVAYRATLLRDRLAPGLPGGHLHTPVLEFAAENAAADSDRFTDPVLVANRHDITVQIRALLMRAADAPR
jgi:pyrrolidone-carboxylate peptidase